MELIKTGLNSNLKLSFMATSNDLSLVKVTNKTTLRQT